MRRLIEDDDDYDEAASKWFGWRTKGGFGGRCNAEGATVGGGRAPHHQLMIRGHRRPGPAMAPSGEIRVHERRPGTTMTGGIAW